MLSISTYLVSASLLLVLSLVVFRRFVRRDYLHQGRLSPLSTFLETALFFLWGIFTWIDLPARWPSPQVGTILKGVALIFIALGLGCMFVTIAAFGFRRALGQKTDELKQSGPYARSRNPQILLCGLAVIGYALLWPSWHTAGWVLLYAAMTHMMVITEEEHLRNQYSDEYKRYCERVPRYLPIPRSLRKASA
jgi:protein-S-isoprenylcysteine O-methyltransferase Ste14